MAAAGAHGGSGAAGTLKIMETLSSLMSRTWSGDDFIITIVMGHEPLLERRGKSWTKITRLSLQTCACVRACAFYFLFFFLSRSATAARGEFEQLDFIN